MRQNSLNTRSLRCTRLIAPSRQSKQVRHATVRAPGSYRDEWVGVGDIGPRGRQRRQRARFVVVEDPVLAPRLANRHKLERSAGQRVERMGDTKDWLRSRVISRSRRLWPRATSSESFARSGVSASTTSSSRMRRGCTGYSQRTSSTTCAREPTSRCPKMRRCRVPSCRRRLGVSSRRPKSAGSTTDIVARRRSGRRRLRVTSARSSCVRRRQLPL
jgi:hypothetical protein